MIREVSIVTGGNRGIGKGIALKLAAEGHDVIVLGRQEDLLKETVKELKDLGSNSSYYAGAAADEKFAEETVKDIEKKCGKIDNLINNAGTRVFKNVAEAVLDDFKKQVDVNLYGIFNFCRSVLPGMISAKKGAIINIASLAGKNAFAGGAMYSATKHAVLGFTRSLMLEVREYNIRVAAVCPGSVDTSFFDGTGMKPNRDKILKVEDVAETVNLILKMPIHALVSEIDIRPTNPK